MRKSPELPLRIVRIIAGLPENAGLFGRLRQHMIDAGISAAVTDHDNRRLYAALMMTFQYQGISDAIADQYVETHGNVDFDGIAMSLERPGKLCPKLSHFDEFRHCGYTKSTKTCANQSKLAKCPLPKWPLRKGPINQTAYSFFLFIRDRCGGDLVGFIDRTLAEADCPDAPDRYQAMAKALFVAMKGVFGVSSKLIGMSFSDILLGADPQRQQWTEVGGHMVAIDTLVHNFLHRTGTLKAYRASHQFGPGCYLPGRCADIITDIARQIDASEFDPVSPAYCPRIIQLAVWRFCSVSILDVCNGTRIDDTKRCRRKDCPVYDICRRVRLHPAST